MRWLVYLEIYLPIYTYLYIIYCHRVIDLSISSSDSLYFCIRGFVYDEEDGFSFYVLV